MKKLLFCLLFGLVTGLYANTGIQDVYWDMPYTKLLLEKKVIEDEMTNVKVLIETNKDNKYIYFFDASTDKLKEILIIGNSTKQFKNKVKTIYFTNYRYEKKSLLEVKGIKCNNLEIYPYLLFMEQVNNYFNQKSGLFNEIINEKLNKSPKGEIQICQSTENTIAFIFENIIENENFIILLPHKGE